MHEGADPTLSMRHAEGHRIVGGSQGLTEPFNAPHKRERVLL